MSTILLKELVNISHSYPEMDIKYSFGRNLIKEAIDYTSPTLDVTKSTKGTSNSKTKEAARRLFYDFYAMEYLHRQFGPSNMSTSAKVKATMNHPEFASGFLSGANWEDVD
jgi:hypothetical protein